MANGNVVTWQKVTVFVGGLLLTILGWQASQLFGDVGENSRAIAVNSNRLTKIEERLESWQEANAAWQREQVKRQEEILSELRKLNERSRP